MEGEEKVRDKGEEDVGRQNTTEGEALGVTRTPRGFPGGFGARSGRVVIDADTRVGRVSQRVVAVALVERLVTTGALCAPDASGDSTTEADKSAASAGAKVWAPVPKAVECLWMVSVLDCLGYHSKSAAGLTSSRPNQMAMAAKKRKVALTRFGMA